MRFRSLFPAMLALSGVLALISLVPVNALPIAAGGKAQCQIIRAAAAAPAELYAGEELALYLGKITGVQFTISEVPAAGLPAIVVGSCDATRAALGEDKLKVLKTEQFVICAKGPNLYIVGGSPRGTLFGVYHFLDNILGVRWWSPTSTFIPTKPDLTVDDALDINEQPVFEYRDAYLFTAWNRDWAARNRLNGPVGDGTPQGPTDAKHGGGFQIYAGPTCHSLDQLIPGSLVEKHPEWFSLVDGKRVAGQYQGQLCLSNPEVLEYLVQLVDVKLQQTPGATNVSITQNDNTTYCRCEKCAKVDAEEGSPAGIMIQFVNQVAEKLEKKYPNVLFDTFAYQYTRKAPKLVRPRHNVMVRLCSIECDFGRPLDTATNQTFAEDAAAWAKISPKIYVWDYITNFTNYFKPHPNLRVLGPNLRFFATHSVKGIMEQGTEATPTGEFEDLRAWVLSRLLWNPFLDDRKVIDEFVNGYYGPAAPLVGQYIALIHDALAGSDYYLGCFATAPAPFLTPEIMSTADTLFKDALKAVAGNEELTLHVRRAYLPVRMMWLENYAEFAQFRKAKGLPEPDAYATVLADCEELVKRYDIRLFGGSSPTADYLAKMRTKAGTLQETTLQGTVNQ